MIEAKHIIESISKTPVLLKELISELPKNRLTKEVKKGKWSIHEHATHIAVSDIYGFQKRLTQFLEEDQPVIEPLSGNDFDEDFFISLNLEDALNSFFEKRKETVKMAKALSSDLLNRQAIHPEYENYTPYIMLRHLMMHDHYHMYAIEDLGYGITVLNSPS